MAKRFMISALVLTVVATGCASRLSADANDLRSPAADTRKSLYENDKNYAATSLVAYYAVSQLERRSSLEEALEICESIAKVSKGIVFQHSVEAVKKNIAKLALLDDATKYSQERVAFEIQATIDNVDRHYSKIADIHTDLKTGAVRTETGKYLHTICRFFMRLN
jgi:hypothetical protein